MPDQKTPSSFDYNVETTLLTTRMAHACGVSVEGELGCLGSLETGKPVKRMVSGRKGRYHMIRC